MKLRNLFLTVVAGLMALTGCDFFENDKPLLGVTVDPTSAELQKEGADLSIKITTSQSWVVTVPKDAADWIMVSPESGTGSATIAIAVGANAGKARKATIRVRAGYDTVPVSVKQEGAIASGDGSKEKPFSPSEARAWVKENLADGEETSVNYYVAGKIHKVQTTFAASGTYGNAVFFMSDDGEASDQDFEAFQVYYLGKRKWKSGDTDVKVGDEVIVCGPLTNYNGTPETVGKGAAYLYKLNDQIVEVDDNPQTEITDATVANFIQSDGSTYYRLTGRVSSFSKGTNNSGKTYMQFNLTDATGTILVYGFKNGEVDKWVDKIKDGGTVVVTGTYEYYEAKSQHEVMNATIESFEEGQVQTEITDCSVSDFIKSDGITYYRLTGIVSSFSKGQTSAGKKYMQFDLTDDTGTILVYGFKDGQYDEWAEKIKDGGTVVLTGTYQFYANTSKHEVMNATIESFTEGEEQTEFEQLTVAAFIQKADPTKAYRLAGKVEDFLIDNPDKKYMKLTLKDDTGSILVYSFVDGEFDKWSASIVKGGDVTLRGYYKLYNNESEVVNATIESFQADPNYKYFGVEKTAIKVAADATKATIKVVSNVAWSAMEATGAPVATGEGTKEFDYTFEANTDTENEKVYSIVITTEADVETKSVTVTITQGKAGEVEEDYSSNVTWTAGSGGAYDEKATVNGKADVKVLKLGTSKAAGSSTLTLPAGSTSLTFYAISWNGKPSKLVFKSGGTEVGSVDPVANSGANNNSPYTLTVTESDKYTITFSATTTLTVETSGSNTRAILFGIQAK